MKVAMRQKRILQAKAGKKDIKEDKILKQLGSLGLPNNVWVYNVCLAALKKEHAT